MTGVQEHFVTIEGAQVHYLRYGEGPALLMLHPLIGSARSLENLMLELGDEFCCIAPDLPGFGLSDPMDDGLDLETIAATIPLIASALKLERPMLYGNGLGAILASLVATNHADGFVGFLLHHYPFSAPKEGNLKTPAGEPLLALWQGLRDYHVSRLTEGGRSISPEIIHEDFIACSQHAVDFTVSRTAIRSFDGLEQLVEIKCPVHFLCGEEDDTPSLPRQMQVTAVSSATVAGVIKTLKSEDAAPHQHPVPEVTALDPAFMTKDYIAIGESRVRQQYRMAKSEAVVFGLHELGLTSEAFNDVFESLSPDITLVTPDIPREIHDLMSYTSFVEGYLKELPEDTVILARDASAGLVLAALDALDHQPRGIILDQPVAAPDGMAADIANFMAFDTKPQAYGEHILHALGRMRDRGSYWPWHIQDSDHVTRDARQLDANLVHERVLSALSNPHYAEQLHLALRQPIFDLASRVTCPIVFLADPRVHLANDIKSLSRSTKFGLYIELTGVEGVEAGLAALGY